MRDTFSQFHPTVNLAYFVLILAFSMWFSNPVCQFISLFSAFTYSIYLRGGRAVRTNFLCLVPLLLISAVINPAFSHQGVTILCYLPSGNPLTLESILYGVSAGAMLVTVICWFSCVNQVFTSDKFVYIFGRIIPSLSLVLSMTLRFVPEFQRQLKQVYKLRSSLGLCKDGIRGGVTALSATVSWAFERSIETADSMKSRGYGLPGRTAYSNYRFEMRDIRALIFLAVCGAIVTAGKCMGALDWRYYPSVRGTFSTLSWWIFGAYGALCLMPVVIDLAEDRKWKALRSSI